MHSWLRIPLSQMLDVLHERQPQSQKSVHHTCMYMYLPGLQIALSYAHGHTCMHAHAQLSHVYFCRVHTVLDVFVHTICVQGKRKNGGMQLVSCSNKETNSMTNGGSN